MYFNKNTCMYILPVLFFVTKLSTCQGPRSFFLTVSLWPHEMTMVINNGQRPSDGKSIITLTLGLFSLLFVKLSIEKMDCYTFYKRPSSIVLIRHWPNSAKLNAKWLHFWTTWALWMNGHKKIRKWTKHNLKQF